MRVESFFGEKLRNLREERGMTLRDLSLRSGIHASTISRLETDQYRRPHVETFIQLARGFEISIQELAVLTDLIDPLDEDAFLIKDRFLRENIRLINKQNLCLLKVLEGTNSITRYHLIELIGQLRTEMDDEGVLCKEGNV